MRIQRKDFTQRLPCVEVFVHVGLEILFPDGISTRHLTGIYGDCLSLD